MPQDAATRTLLASSRGEAASFDQLFRLVFDELRELAAAHMRRERSDHTLQPTALVNEAYLRLIRIQDVEWQDRTHFFAVAARCLRRLLLEHARKRHTSKRGEGATRVTLLEPEMSGAGPVDVALLDLEEALGELEARDARQAKVVELRFFGGLSVAEAAQQLGCSPGTVKNDWRFARAWLHARLA